MDPTTYPDRVDQALCGLILAAGDPVEARAAAVVSKHLLEKHGIHIHWRTIETEFRKAKNLVKASKRDGQWVFAPLKACLEHLNGAASDILLVDPSKAVAATATLHDTLAALSGTIRVCDPYLDAQTLHHLDAVPTQSTIRLLTYNITDSGTTRSLVQAFASKGVTLEVRRAHANVMHDRYVIAGQGVLILGTSLNGFGKKQCFVVRAGQSIAGSLTKTFDDLWAKATSWP
ncbi:MAG: hypothetical protein ACKVU4_07200 [Phycisphaerales bacterium]